MSTTNEPTKRTFEVLGSAETITLTDFRGIVAGYTGRDMAAVQHHIDELAAIGVAPPPEIPMFYPVDAELFDSCGEHPGSVNLTSGEIEPLYIRHNGRFYLGIGSDHTDRDLETKDIGASKRACPKPVAAQVVALDGLGSLCLDGCTARSWADGRPYQEGTLDGIRTPADIVELLLERTDIGDQDFLCLGGTLPLLDGKFIDGTEWRLELAFPDGTTLEHTYKMTKGTD